MNVPLYLRHLGGKWSSWFLSLEVQLEGRRGLCYFFDQIEVKLYCFRHDVTQKKKNAGGAVGREKGGGLLF